MFLSFCRLGYSAFSESNITKLSVIRGHCMSALEGSKK